MSFFKRLLFFYFLLFVLVDVWSQELVPFRIGDKWGYSNRLGELLITVIYDSVSLFEYGNMAIVQLEDEIFCINKNNDRVKCPKDRAVCSGVKCSPTTSLRIHNKNGRVGIVNERMKPFVDNIHHLYYLDSMPAIWGRICGNGYELIAVERGDNWGIVDREYRTVVDLEYDMIRVEGRYFVLSKDDRLGVADRNGEIVVPPKYRKIDFLYDFDLIRVLCADGKWGYINRTGKEYFKS